MDNFDVLSDVFSNLRIRSSLYFLAKLRGDFSIEVPPERRRIRFHFVREGRCWLRMPDGEARELSDGDLAIVPNGAGQVLSSAPAIDPVPLAEVVADGALEQGVLTYGQGSRRTRLLCGFCHFDEVIEHPVLASLPEIMILRPEDLGREPWISAVLRLLAMEAELDGQGTTGILTRLLEVLFIQTVRRMAAAAERESNPGNFVMALSDRQISKALHAIHQQPHRSWKIQGLAEIAGMSRARFAQRFSDVVGIPPIGYLTRWRLIKARNLLVSSNLDMAEIASRCGYASTPSFSRRFKETYGVGPGAFRRAGIMM
ncbi:AraC family transcriptional regulator [Denitrobaculum tricleocarpae]|uniref:AraC family transcriptional regulator n=1 Tax=Denitrobaculum tricleocarpae TaxID=2591009 RepID=A0A545TU55_9PROT|nr:AraC family transcriptional regulator [Denitrobaculum tricleocarpae]TQV80746.1 AraC family transcriptional regulator [Denitrobaculum tricleocarpae]